ncbi:hypothetical protein ACFPRL_34265 [Pseudoclavibacter helvolus]
MSEPTVRLPRSLLARVQRSGLPLHESVHIEADQSFALGAHDVVPRTRHGEQQVVVPVRALRRLVVPAQQLVDELETRQLTDGVALRDLERVCPREPLDQRRRSRSSLQRLRDIRLRDPEHLRDLALRPQGRELPHFADVCEPVELRTTAEQTRLLGAVFKLSRHTHPQVVIHHRIKAFSRSPWH